MSGDVMAFSEVGDGDVDLVGGKGAALGELSRIDGLAVPAGFCVATRAYTRALARAGVSGEEDPAIVRAALCRADIPDDLRAAVATGLAALGFHVACTVRSSATTEDVLGASSAGQHDSVLDVTGLPAVLQAIRVCWASLFSDRAVSDRTRRGLDLRAVRMAVVVQRMVRARAAGVLFTADPVSGNRRVTAVEAIAGPGDALVSGHAAVDACNVRDGAVTRPGGADAPVLSDAQVTELERIGRRIEAHFGSPQDIEWCLADGGFEIVQSRPITTLFPIPQAGDADNHVYLSVGHQQMMTDAMTPLGLSVWQLTTPRPMAVAGGRLFVDVTADLASPEPSPRLAGLEAADPLTADALATLRARGFVPVGPGGEPDSEDRRAPAERWPAPSVIDPELVTELIARHEASIRGARDQIAAVSGPELIDFILEDIGELRRLLFDPDGLGAIMAALEAGRWLEGHLREWLDMPGAADRLGQSLPHNVTAQMGLALLDVADVIRPHPEVVALLREADDEAFLDELPAVSGGREAQAAIHDFLDRFGMRCAGEIDITRPRFSEQPLSLVPVILSHVANAEPGAGERRFDQGRADALRTAQDVLARLRAQPDGGRRARAAEARIEQLRTFGGYREYPKYGMVSRYLVYKRALMAQARCLTQAGILAAPDDVFFLAIEELREVLVNGRADAGLIRVRRQAHRIHQSLRPPRVLTSEGEGIDGAYRRADVPAGALVGLAASAGRAEGRARVIVDLAAADLAPGDILVTTYTDPSWTPAFVAVRALVTEVGGRMTHGAVIAREYGLPAVVAAPHATRRISDGQRIRVDGTAGWVEILA